MDAARIDASAVASLVDRYRIDTVGISVFTRTRRISYEIARILRAHRPSLYILLGGAHCTISPEDALACTAADVVVQGEAEDTMVELVESRPRGLIQADLRRSLDELPWPRLDAGLLDSFSYGHFLGVKWAARTAVAASSRGCPCRCAFCMRVGLMPYRRRSPESFVGELGRLAEAGYSAVILNDDNFLADEPRAMAIAEALARAQLGLSLAFQCSVRPSTDLWAVLHEAGLVIACVGIEHVRPAVLAYLEKDQRPETWGERTAKTLATLNRLGIIVSASFIVGTPPENREDALAMVRFLKENGVDFLNCNELLYAFGTPLWRRAVAEGVFSPQRLYVRASSVFPEKAAYIEEVNTAAWRCSMHGLPRVVSKIMHSRMRDKRTPIWSLAQWLLRGGVHALRHSPNQGYGRQEEV
jgi:radical SAM superfamily enzyme YgiQ (UPF0313 family)